MNQKAKAKGHAILRAKSNIRPPDFNIMDYDRSMTRSLNFYRDLDNTDKKKFAIDYWKSVGKDTKDVSSVADCWFSTVGAVAHMATNGVPLHEKDLIKLDVYFEKISALVEKEETPKEKSSVQENIQEIVSIHIGEIEGMLDDLVKTGNPFDTKQYLTSNQVKPLITKRIGEWFKAKQKQYTADFNDADLVVGYSNLGKRGMNRLLAQLGSIVSDCTNVAIVAKTTKAPRVRKEKPASVLVAKVKYKKDFTELSLKSITPDKMVGADVVVLYDTVKRRLYRYEASEGYALSVKGMTLMNFNPDKSGGKIIRKPDVQLKDISKMTKRPFNALFNGINATVGVPTGRINEDMIIVSCFN